MAGFTVLGLLVAAVDRGNPEGEAVPETPAVTTGGEESIPAASNASDGQASAAIAAPVLVAAASIPPLADLVERIGGERVEVVSIVPQGVDGHTYEPTPSDVVGLAQVDVKFFASRDLNPAVTRAVEANLPSSALTVDLMDLTVPMTEVIADASQSHGSGGSRVAIQPLPRHSASRSWFVSEANDSPAHTEKEMVTLEFGITAA